MIHAARRQRHRFRAGGEPPYGLVLVIVLVLYVVVSASDRHWVQPAVFGLTVATMAVIALPERIGRRWWMAGAAAASVLLILATLVAVWPSGWRTGFLDVVIALLMLVASANMVVRLVARPTITARTVFGAIDVYALVGLAFAILFHGVQSWSGDPYFTDATEGTRNIFTYYSFVTLSTLGYGEFVPATDVGRSLAVVEVLMGQILLVGVVARLVSVMRSPRIPRSEPQSGS